MNHHRLPALALALAACNGGAAVTLVETRNIDPGEDCAGGGVQIRTGIDADKDGTLADSEVSDTQLVCSGASGVDGEPGLPGSDGTDGLEGVPYPITSIEEPPGDAGTSRIDASGGNGSVGYGGSGGDVDTEMDYSSSGGHIKFVTTGTVDASFTPPAAVSTHLGETPVDFTATQTLLVRAAGDHTGIGAGQPHFHSADSNLYVQQDGVDERVSGVHVAAGVTVTLPLTYTTYTNLRITHDIHNEGTITTARDADGVSAGSLYIDCGGFYGAAGSLIDLSGADGTTSVGNGGDIDIDISADWSAYEDLGSFFNDGTIDTSGGNGNDGGEGGDIDIDAEQWLVNTGDLILHGGAGSTGSGGGSGEVDMYTAYGNVWNSGDIDCSGGDGFDRGGAGDSIYIEVGYIGEVRNTGSLTTRGGDVSPSCVTDCYGGDGDYVEYYLYGASVFHNATVDASGGSGGPGYGGDGDDFNIYFYDEYGWQGGDVPTGSAHVAGNINLSGGDGGYGGSGGDIDVELDADVFSTNQEIVFFGYASIDQSGGDGASDGGNGGDFTCYQDYGYQDALEDGPPGSCVNYTDVDVSGGNGTSGSGGSAGEFYLETDEDYMVDGAGARAYNAGAISMRGGNGATGGGRGGYAWIYGYNGAENHGPIDARGGDTNGATSSAGHGDEVYILADWGDAINTARIDTRGGAASGAGGYGGDGGSIEIAGNGASNSAELSSAGGSGGMTSGYGGDGGLIVIYGTTSSTTNTSTTFSFGGGMADEPGETGELHIGGMNMSSTF